MDNIVDIKADVALDDRLLEVAESLLGNAMNSLRVEDIGWNVIGGFFGVHPDSGGITLADLRMVSEKCAQYQELVPLIKHAVELRASFIWGGGVVVPGAHMGGRRSAGKPSAVDRFVKDNRKLLFSADGWELLEKQAASDGVIVALVHKGSKRVHVLPLREISDVWVDKDWGDEVVAYQRCWNVYTNGQPVEHKRWYYLNSYTGARAKALGEGTERVAVDDAYTVFEVRFNRLRGNLFGLPDTAPALPAYSELSKVFKAGVDVQLALASMIYKVTNKTTAGNKNSANQVASMRGSGNTAHILEGQDVAPLASAGKGYDFESAIMLASPIASNYGISVIDLLSHSGAAGSSYGAAQNMNLPRSKRIQMRQEQWAEFYRDILSYVAGEQVEVVFPYVEDEAPLQAIQSANLAWNSGNMTTDEYNELKRRVFKFTTPDKGSPEGVMYPNNENSSLRSDVDPVNAAKAPIQSGAGQGQSTGVGDLTDNSGTRKDRVTDQ
jgi:hypothetical protein